MLTRRQFFALGGADAFVIDTVRIPADVVESVITS
mgnify:CR=1 FL=1